MVPVAFVTLSALPLTVNDKIDVDALPQPELLGEAMSYEPPEGEIEVTLANLWAELLGVQRVGRNDSFFDLGGHSILAVQMIARVQEIFGVEMQLASVFQSSTLALVADAIASGELSKADPMEVARLSAEINEYSREKLERLLGMRPLRKYPHPENGQHTVHVYAMGPGGPAAELHVAVQPGLAQ